MPRLTGRQAACLCGAAAEPSTAGGGCCVACGRLQEAACRGSSLTARAAANAELVQRRSPLTFALYVGAVRFGADADVLAAEALGFSDEHAAALAQRIRAQAAFARPAYRTVTKETPNAQPNRNRRQAAHR